MEPGDAKLGSQSRDESRIQLGTNQSGMRAHNERLVLSLVRQHGSLAKSDIARMTKLSAQTVSVIMRELERDGLLRKEEPIRGKIGQPSIPMSLHPEGAFFLGLKIGRRSAELVLIDFVGEVRAMLHSSYLYPAPEETIAFVRKGIRTLRAGLSDEQDRRIAGLGIAHPFNCGTGRTRWVRRAKPWTNGGVWTCAPNFKRNSVSPSISRMTRHPPAAPSWFSAAAAVCAISSISTSARSPAAASCSTASSTADRPAMPARSDPCPCRAPRGGPRS